MVSDRCSLPQGRHPLDVLLLRSTLTSRAPSLAEAALSAPSLLVEERDAPGPSTQADSGFLPLSPLRAHRLASNRKFKEKRRSDASSPGAGASCCLRTGPSCRRPWWQSFHSHSLPSFLQARGGPLSPSRGQHPPLLAAEQAAQGTGFGSLASLLSEKASGSGLQTSGPGTAGATRTEAGLAQRASGVTGG